MTVITTARETKAISTEVVIPCFLVNYISYLWPMYVRCIRDHLFITFACQKYECYFQIVHNEIINCSWYCFFVIFKSNQLPYKLTLWQEDDLSFQIQNLHTVRSCPHTPEKSGNVLFRHENRAFLKRFSNRSNLKTPAGFSGGRRKLTLKNGPFRKLWRCNNHAISLAGFSSNTNAKSVGDCCFLKFLRRGLNEKHLQC